jgi:hypothetical protein
VRTSAAMIPAFTRGTSTDGLPPNGLGISGGALIDRYGCRADSTVQKSPDLAGAERRPLHARVSPQPRPELWGGKTGMMQVLLAVFVD